jgi:hypothetical protein
MRPSSIILVGLIMLASSPLAISQEEVFRELKSKIASMEHLIVSMESKDSEWKVRSDMQQHALLMAESVEITRNLYGSVSEEPNQGQGTSLMNVTSETTDEIENIDLQLRTLNTLLRHAIIRQNIMMERMGLFN